MSYYTNLKQNLEQKIQNLTSSYLTNKNKMGFGTKVLLGGLAVAGAGYMVWRKIWNYFYPPSFKRYFAVGCMVFAFWGVRNCDTVKTGLGSLYQGTRKAIEQRIDRTEQVKKLETRLKGLTADNLHLKEYKAKNSVVLANAEEYIKELEDKVGELTINNNHFKESNIRKDIVLENAKEYINNLEQQYFNTKYSKRKGLFGMLKNKPSQEAFLEYLLYNKEYNSIMYEIDNEIKKD